MPHKADSSTDNYLLNSYILTGRSSFAPAELRRMKIKPGMFRADKAKRQNGPILTLRPKAAEPALGGIDRTVVFYSLHKETLLIS